MTTIRIRRLQVLHNQARNSRNLHGSWSNSVALRICNCHTSLWVTVCI